MSDPDQKKYRSRLRRNLVLIRCMAFSWMFLILMPVIVPFFKSVGLQDGDVFLVQAIFSGAVAILEVPTGYVSDLLGRKRTLVVAGLLHGVAFSILPFVHGFTGVVIYELVAALAVSLYSGTDVALQYDSVEALGETEGRRKGLGQRLFWMQSGETLAALVGGWLVIRGLDTVATWNAIVGWVPFLAALFLMDVNIDRMGANSHRENFGRIVNELFRVSPVVRGVLWNLIAYGLATLCAVWIFQGYWQELGVPLVYFGYIWAGYNLVVALVGRYAHTIERVLGTLWTHRAIAFLPVVGYFGMAWVFGAGRGTLWWIAGVAMGLTFQVGHGLTQVVLKDELNVRVPPEMRATANSISSLGVRIGFVALAPLLKVLIDNHGYDRTLQTFGSGYFLVALLVAWPLMRLMRGEREAGLG
ncbi:MAG: MFS transporter [Planctomycetota bacterium]|nr:MFS transporter [Planctomycetota bacterium]